MDRSGNWVVVLSLVAIAAGLIAIVLGCQYAKPACTVVDVAHAACEYVTVEYVDNDGKVVREQVPREELRALAVRTRTTREAKEALSR